MPATLASRIRVLATGRSNKNDPNDAHSIAIAALRAPSAAQVEPADHGEVLRLLSKRNSDLGSQRTRVICRLHSLFAELAPGGIAKEMYVSDAEALLAQGAAQSPGPTDALRPRPRAPRRRAPSRRPDQGVAPPHPAGRQGVGHVGHRALWGGPDPSPPSSSATPATSVASPTVTPTPPTTARLRSNCSSGGRVVHRLSRRGNRKLNHALHMAADHPDPQSRHARSDLLRAQGRRRQDEEGSAPLAQAPDLQRRLPPAAARRPIGGPGGHSGTTRCLRDRLFTLRDRLFGEVTPEPIETLRRRVLLMTARFVAPGTTWKLGS